MLISQQFRSKFLNNHRPLNILKYVDHFPGNLARFINPYKFSLSEMMSLSCCTTPQPWSQSSRFSFDSKSNVIFFTLKICPFSGEIYNPSSAAFADQSAVAASAAFFTRKGSCGFFRERSSRPRWSLCSWIFATNLITYTHTAGARTHTHTQTRSITHDFPLPLLSRRNSSTIQCNWTFKPSVRLLRNTVGVVFHSLVERIHDNFHKSVGVLVSRGKIFFYFFLTGG